MDVQTKQIRKEAGRIGWGLILYGLIFMAVIFVSYMVAGICLIIKSPNAANQEAVYEQLMSMCEASGLPYLFAIALGMLFIVLFFRRKVRLSEIMHSEHKMTFGVFVAFLAICLGYQGFSSIFSTLLEVGLNQIGYTSIGSVEVATGVSATVSMFLYSSIAGPIVEELVYRGVVLRSFQKYGKKFAIVISAILFGVMHGNLPQGIFAFGIGLVFGYVASEYSILWSIALHVFNNMVFSDALGWLMEATKLPENTQDYVLGGIMLVFLLVSCIVLWRKRTSIKAFFAKYPTIHGGYKGVFTSVGILLFIVMELALAISTLEPLA